jgi:AcrR family transcriptional regulator
MRAEYTLVQDICIESEKMGHKEELLAAARRCLVTRGYAKTTARDLVAESGTNLASIGYHFGSKEALLMNAMDDVAMEYTERVLDLAAAVGAEATDPGQAVATAWVTMTDMLREEGVRPLLISFVEALAQAQRSDSLRARLAEAYQEMRRRIVDGVLAVVPDLPEEMARTIASFFMAVSDGYMVQWLLDADATPSGEDLLEGARLTMSV